MTKDQTPAHFEASMAAQANAHAITAEALDAAQRLLASYARSRLLKKTPLSSAVHGGDSRSGPHGTPGDNARLR
jgi:hypothetical protein